MNYEFHEVADIFPMMSEIEFSGLVEDIRKNGQREPIWVHQEKIVDGRNRYNACREIGVIPLVKEWNNKGSLVDFVMSMNFHRRQMNEAQRGSVGAKVKHIFEADAKKRQIELAGTRPNSDPSFKKSQGNEMPMTSIEAIGENDRSATKAAKLVNSSRSSVERAGRVIRNGVPEIIESVDRGKLSLAKAEAISKLPKEQQAEFLKKVIANEPIKSKPFQLEPATQPPVFMEGATNLQEILENISMTLGTLIGQAETELLSLPKSTVKNAKYQVGACIDAIHKCADRLEISLKMCK